MDVTGSDFSFDIFLHLRGHKTISIADFDSSRLLIRQKSAAADLWRLDGSEMERVNLSVGQRFVQY